MSLYLPTIWWLNANVMARKSDGITIDHLFMTK
jgi:hypothetical protein